MKAIVQDRYGSADVLELRDIDVPGVGSDGVLLRVRAASAHIGDWHTMTGLPYLIRIVVPDLGLRAPKVASEAWMSQLASRRSARTWKRDTPEARSSSPSEGRTKEGDCSWDRLRLQLTRSLGRETGTVRAR
jgi:hypothetical protein